MNNWKERIVGGGLLTLLYLFIGVVIMLIVVLAFLPLTVTGFSGLLDALGRLALYSFLAVAICYPYQSLWKR